MNILISSLFYPSTGGIETVMSLLAHEWIKMGHDVRVVTFIPLSDEDNQIFPFEVVRFPDRRQLVENVKWCDVYVHGNISLRTLWPLALCRRRLVATHHTNYRRDGGGVGWQDRLKMQVIRRAINIACSQSIADELPVPCAVIGNPYEETRFFNDPDVERDSELAFVGRLVSDKGVDVLLEALSLLNQQGEKRTLTIIGDGPDRPALEAQTRSLELESQVTFVGRQPPEEVARLLNRHRVLVVPSIWNEPFGVVALEGIACGCVVIGSEGGGLKDAIGPCGVTFPNGDSVKLAEQISLLWENANLQSSLLAFAPQHLLRHQAPFVAQRYLEEITKQLAS